MFYRKWRIFNLLNNAPLRYGSNSHFFNIYNCFLGKKILTNHHHMISKKYLNMITYSPNRCVISAICYILVIVGIQINNRLDSKERHESCQFAFERQSEGIDLNPRGMT